MLFGRASERETHQLNPDDEAFANRVWRHKKRQIRKLMQICLLHLKAGGENIWHNTRRCDELWVLADGLKWGWRKSVYLANFFGSKIVVVVI